MTMQNKSLLLLTVLLSSSVFSQQSGWFSQNEVFVTSKNISSVQQFDVNTAIVVGADGLVMKTTNAGSSFVTISTGRTAFLNEVFFISPQIGWAVGSSGEVIKSTDGGASWTPQNSGSTSSLLTVHFVDATTGWIGGTDSKIRKTTDGGVSWNVLYTGSSGTTFKDIHFRDASFGIAAGYIGNAAYMFRTTDGGTTWTSTWLNSGWGYGVHIINENIAWGVGETARITTVSDPFGGGGTTITDRKSVRWKTTNGGQSWTEVASTTSRFYSKIFFLDENNGWAAGTNGAVVRTTDAGATWYQHSAGSSASLRDVHFVNNQEGHVVGENGLISKTTDGGITWTRVSGRPTNSDLSSVFFLNPTTGWIGGSSYEVLKTTDGGTSWQMLPIAFTSKVNALSFSDASTGCAAVSSTIYRTTDGGATWPKANYIYAEIKSLSFVDASIGYAVGASGKIVKTTNGGVDWQNQTSGTSDGLMSVHFTDASTGWAAGANGRILKTTTGGTQWTAQMSGVTDSLWSVRFTDASKGFAVGRNGIILSTTDGGAQWTRIFIEVTKSLYSINFATATAGWLAGAGGVVLKTTDGGLSWGQQTSGTAQTISAIVFANSSTGWIVGSSGLIMKTTDGGGSASFPPSLLFPANRVTGLSRILQLRWNAVSEAQSYRVQVSTSSSFSSIVTDQSGVSVRLLDFSNLMENTIYYWRVKAEYAQTSSDWSAVWCFATGSTAGWNIQITGTKNALGGVYFVNERVGWAVGEYGTIIKTTDGGMNWNAQSSSLTYSFFGSVQFRDTLKGWLLAERSNIILKTTNGGTSWERSDAPYSELYTLYFVDDQNGWAAGLNGTIVKTTNGGSSWTQQITGQAKQLNAIHFVDALYGWAAGYNNDYKALMLRTTNGGVTWTSLSMGSTSSISDICFVDRNTGFAIGGSGGEILKTTDGGISWSKYTVNIAYSSLNRIRFLNQQVGWIVGGAGYVFKTSDGGQTWGPQASNTTSYIYDIHFVDATKGWIVGGGYSEGGVVLKTTSGGGSMMAPPRPLSPSDRSTGLTTTQQVTWTRVQEALSYKLTCSGLSYNVSQSGLVDTSFVLTNLSPNTIYRWCVAAQYQNRISEYSPYFWFATTGTDWKAQICGTINSINSVFFIDASTGWAVGGSYSAGEIYKTTDGGATWATQQNPSQDELNKIQFVDQYKGWAVGGDYSAGVVLATTDGGATWIKQSMNPGKEITDLYFIDAQTGWLVAWGGLIHKTTDAGVNWTLQASGTTDILYGVHFVNSQTGWVVGAYNTLLKTTNGGATWTKQTTSLGTLYDICVIDFENAFVVSYGGSIAKTTDGGITWSTQFSNPSVNLTSVSFADSKNGWVSGAKGAILKTTDGGITWGSQRPEINQYFSSVFCVDASTAWIASRNGALLKTTNGGGAASYLPSIPRLISPANAQSMVPITPTIQWNAAKEALSYDVEVSTKTSFSPLAFSKQGITDTSCSPTGLLGSTIYYWRVKANNPVGSSDWSSVWSFTTIMQAPAVPTLASPIHKAMNQSLSMTLSWNPASNAQTYHMQFGLDSLFTAVVVDDSLLTSQQREIGPLEEGKTYYWRVRAKNEGGTSAWSTVWSFTTKIYLGPPMPVLLAPANSRLDLALTVLLQWSSSRNATSYRVQLATDQNFTIKAVDKTVSDTAYSVGDLDSKKLYFWRVSAINLIDTSPWSTVWSFTTARIGPPKPILLYPPNTQAEVPLGTTLLWGSSDGAAGYEVQVSSNSDFQVLFVNQKLADTSYSISGLQTGNAYYWRVRASDNTGTSSWSQVFVFYTGGAWKVLAGSYGNVQTISFISPAFGWMGNSSGGVYVSKDRGISWIARSTSYATTRSYCFLDTSMAWMVGWTGLIKKTTDGGKSWITQVSNTTKEIKDVSFSDGNNGWAVADSLILRTTNGGSTWTSQPAPSLTYLYGVKAISSSVGIVLNASRLMKTTDGGALWTSQPLPGYAFLQGIHFIDTMTGWVVGADGALLKTTDGGSTWKFQQSGTPNWLISVHFIDPNIGWAVGWDGTIIKTTDGGETWGVQHSGSMNSFETVYALDASTVFAGGGDLLTTAAGGGVTHYPPLLLAPVNQAKGIPTNPVLSWTPVAAVRYQLQVSTYSRFYSFATVVDDTSLTVTSKQVSSLNANSTYYWRIIGKTSHGLKLCSAVWSFTTGSSSTSVEDVAGLPGTLYLYQNYPNPFNPSTAIEFDVSKECYVTLKIYNTLGNEVATLVASTLSPGRYRVTWNASIVSTGVYFCRMQARQLSGGQAGEFVMTKRLLLLK